VLLGIPPLADPLHDDRTSIGSAIADLLWFPTGGGKTEAYLGLAAFTMAIRRLQGAVGDLDGMRGVAVIMRYTLRLLTIQQFQRASTLICAMEYLRGKALESGDESLGTTPFRLGLWVGQRATPNRTSDAEVAVQNAHGDSYQNRGTGTPQQLRNCPWCGSKIEMGKGHIKVKPLSGDIGRTLTFCSDKYGRCLFSERQSPNEGIPVVVVDEEIYRLLPAMIVGTVDKFAQMPWKGEVQALFGRVSGECPRHGFISPDTEADCNGRHRKSGNLPATVRIDCKRLRPPDLVIQDEFHLISGPLGTMVGLYETAVDELCSWELDGKRIHPKVLASTATARRAREQMHAVFLRQVEIFPPHGIDAVDNFFSRQRRVSAEKPGRRYMGICAPGHSRPAVLIRVYTAFLTAAEALRQTYGAIADPWMTCVGYFNSLRELGGMRRLVEDDVKTRAYRIERGELSRPGLAQRDIRVIEELTSRASSTDIPKILDRLEHRFRGTDEDKAQPAIDVVLATNMISVGVDVQRLGLMIVNGQPKTTAEYIQASSRVGRHHPGLVCTVLNWSRPRGLSHYETFEHYHSTFYQHVEAQSVSPFSPRAVDRGLTGVLASLIRLDDSEYNPNEGAGRLEISGAPAAVRAVDSVSQRAWEVTESDDAKKHVRHALEHRIDRWVNESEVPGRQLGYKPKRDGSTVGLLKVPGVRSWGVFTVPTSMREVEPPASLILEEEVRFDSPSWRSNSDSGDK
jgi:ribosomal protein L24E